MDAPTTPFPLRRRRLLQFTLRGLLLLIAICSVGLGLAFHRARQQSRAVAAIQSFHGYVFYDFQGVDSDSFNQWGTSKVPGWLLDSLGVDFFHNVTLVAFDVGPVTDDVLAPLFTLRKVRYLFFDSSLVTDAGLAHLKGLEKLQVLRMSAGENETGGFDTPDFTDAGLAEIAELRDLQELTIDHAVISDRGLQHLTSLSNLRFLKLGDTKVTRAGTEALSKSLPDCYIYASHGLEEIFHVAPHGAPPGW
jgi:hypothetical protein